MGDEDDRHALFILQELDELEDLGLHGDVERGRRLVGDQQLRLAGERHRDHDALAHAAGEPMRIFVQALARGGHAHPLEDAQRLGLGRRPVEPAMMHQRLGDLEADGEHRVEARHRLLEDHRQLVAAHIAHLLLGELQEVAAVETDHALDPAVGGRKKPHHRECRDALAGTRFADDRDGLARADIEGQIFDGRPPDVVDAKGDRKVADGKNGLRIGNGHGRDYCLGARRWLPRLRAHSRKVRIQMF